jgi:hypothetical protein
MLDPASLEKLAAAPEQNDPMLNIALAEEGGAEVLLSLASCPEVRAEAIAVIAGRLEREREALTLADEAGEVPAVLLARKIVAHPHASPEVRDSTLRHHWDDPFFVLSAGAHRDATRFALERLASWPGASPLHDRPWIAALRSAANDAALLAHWAQGAEPLREAAGALARDESLLQKLARDPSRRVRRAVAGNAHDAALRGVLAESDGAPEVRARARRAPEHDGPSFATMLRAMENGGTLAPDVRRALLDAGTLLDEEGAFLGARHLDEEALHALVSQTTGPERDPLDPRGAGVGVGLGLRRAATTDGHDAQLSQDIVHLLTRHPSAATRLTGKARVALWIAEALSRSRLNVAGEQGAIAPGTLASDRLVLYRCASAPAFSNVAAWLDSPHAVPASVVELAWQNGAVSDDDVAALARRVACSVRSERELPEDELDLLPLARPLPVLERVVLAAIARVPVSPRAALAAIALEPRRCRYVLSAMPTWKGLLTGARLARVLRSYAGALSAAAGRHPSSAPPASGARAPSVARWTDRKLVELEAAIAIAVGDLTAAELVRRLSSGTVRLQDGLALAAAVEARAALDGPAAFAPLLDHAAAQRAKDPAALALWMLLESLDRVRAPSLLGSAIDGLAVAGSVVAPAVCEALASLERRSPGRLEAVHAQSPRGKATVASAIARAYRAFGGMRDES